MVESGSKWTLHSQTNYKWSNKLLCTRLPNMQTVIDEQLLKVFKLCVLNLYNSGRNRSLKVQQKLLVSFTTECVCFCLAHTHVSATEQHGLSSATEVDAKTDTEHN